MPVRVLGEKTGNYTPARTTHQPSRMDPDLLALALSQTETIERMRAGDPKHQTTEPEDTQ